MHVTTTTTILTTLLSLITLPATASLHGKCTRDVGQGDRPCVCEYESTCRNKGGRVWVGACPWDPNSIRGCTKRPCTDHGDGVCEWVSTCRAAGIEPISNRCPGGSNFKCCDYGIWVKE